MERQNCHSERSEEYSKLIKLIYLTGSFASLRMTEKEEDDNKKRAQSDNKKRAQGDGERKKGMTKKK